MSEKKHRYLIGLFLLIFAWTSSCGEPIPVDCATEEECTTENEGGFQTGTVAGIAAGGAAALALAGGAVGGGGGDGGGSSSSSNSLPTLTGALIDSAVGGVSFNSTSGLSGTTSTSGTFKYREGDKITFTLGGILLGTVTGTPIITPLELVGATTTVDQRVVNIARLLQTLDNDLNPNNGIFISSTFRNSLEGQSLNFEQTPSLFADKANTILQNPIISRILIEGAEAISHLHGTLQDQGRSEQVGESNQLTELLASTNSCFFDGIEIIHNNSVIAYESNNVSYGGTCQSQSRVCENGILSGNYAFSTCAEILPGTFSYESQDKTYFHYALTDQPQSFPFMHINSNNALQFAGGGGLVGGYFFIHDGSSYVKITDQFDLLGSILKSSIDLVSLYTTGNVDNGFGYTFDGKEISVKFRNDLGERVSQINQVYNHLTIRRPIAGTVNQNFLTKNCGNFEITNFAEGLVQGGQMLLYPDDTIKGGEMDLVRVGEHSLNVCTDSPTGEHKIKFMALDGIGGSKELELTVEVLEERVVEGSITFEKTAGDSGDNNITIEEGYGLKIRYNYESENHGDGIFPSWEKLENGSNLFCFGNWSSVIDLDRNIHYEAYGKVLIPYDQMRLYLEPWGLTMNVEINEDTLTVNCETVNPSLVCSKKYYGDQENCNNVPVEGTPIN